MVLHSQTIKTTSSATSHKGLRRKINEDSIVSLPNQGLWVVADGMGGHSRGDYASQTITRALEDLTLIRGQDLSVYSNAVINCVRGVNNHLVERGSEPDTGVIGSTLAALIIDGNRCGLLWAGDSRIYRQRGKSLDQLTDDHSFVNEMINQGKLSASEAASHPDANAITRAIGASYDLDLDQTTESVISGDRFLLCSDGLYREVSNSDLLEVMSSNRNTKDTMDRLLELALEGGGRDNISIIVVEIS